MSETESLGKHGIPLSCIWPDTHYFVGLSVLLLMMARSISLVFGVVVFNDAYLPEPPHL